MRWLRVAPVSRSFVDKAVEAVDKLQQPRFDGQCVLGVMAKEPRVGTVKTRMCPPLGVEEAAALYAVSLEETVARMRQGDWQTVIFYTGARSYFSQQFPELPIYEQQGADLGERMENALRGLLAAGARSAVLMGSDSPDLPLEHVACAFDCLEKTPAVLAPAADGGYVLIGESCHQPALFSGIAWSTGQVLALTRERATQASIALCEIEPWDDLDDMAALNRLLQRSPATLTADFIRTHLAHRGLYSTQEVDDL